MSDDPVAARKDAIVIAISVAPDVCVMPNGVVACFDLIAYGTDAINYCPTVRANGAEVIKLDTQLMMCIGDDTAATGIVSGTIKGNVDMLPNACTVNSQSQCTIRDGDPCMMNNKNTPGILKVLAAAAIDEAAGIANSAGARYGEMVNDANDAEKDVNKKKNNRPKNRGKGKAKFDKANEAYKSAKAEAARMQVPGGKGKLGTAAGKLVKKVPGIGNAVDIYSIGSEVLEGDSCGVLVESAGAGAGAATGVGGGLVCGALGLAGGWPGLVCAGVVVLGSAGASYGAKKATTSALGTDSCPAPESNSPSSTPDGRTSGPSPTSNPTPTPSASQTVPPSSGTSPVPAPAPHPTPTPSPS